MADRLETVTVTLDGKSFVGWTSIEVTAGAEKAVRTARLAMPLSVAKGLTFGLAAVVKAGGEALLTGWTRDVDRSRDGRGGEATVTLVSATADAVEGSVDHPTGSIEKKDLKGIAEELAKDFKIIAKGTLKTIDYHQLVPGESLHRTLERLARREGVLIYDDGDGAIVLADKPAGRHKGAIEAGVNILRASFSRTEQGRHDETIVRGQSSRGHGAGALRLEARAKDGAVTRKRPRVIVLEEDASSEGAKKRAEWSARRAAGKSIRASAEVPGWRDAGGVLWTPNFVVHFRDGELEADQDMAIASVTYRQGDAGTVAELTLVDPRAFGGDAPEAAAPLPVPKPKATVSAAP